MRFAIALPLLLLAACGTANSQPAPLAAGTNVDRLLVDKSDRVLIGYAKGREVVRYTHIRLGDAPVGHKRFEGDEKTPEGDYIISGRNPKSAYHLSLRISYPNAADRAYAKARGRSPGGDIFIHGQPNAWIGPTITRDWTDGCIALHNTEIKQLWDAVPDGTPITIRP
ncbi:L,D-transpeptidase family protein [Sphingopyxis sp.]|uniref:L,D-transpeptidase family protein n=1 Tax=Sphingopyxis sp. TaxID=1908224 RepID=UPI003D0C74A7